MPRRSCRSATESRFRTSGTRSPSPPTNRPCPSRFSGSPSISTRRTARGSSLFSFSSVRRPEFTSRCSRNSLLPSTTRDFVRRSAAANRLTKSRVVEGKSDFREHLEVNSGRRTDEKEKSEDPLAVRRVEIDGLPEKREGQGRFVGGEGDRVPDVRNRDSVADRHDRRGIPGEEEVKQRLPVSLVVELQQGDDRAESLLTRSSADIVKNPSAFEALGDRRDALVLVLSVE